MIMKKVDRKNACFASAVGSLQEIRKAEPSVYTRRAHTCQNLIDELYKIVDTLPEIDPSDIQKYVPVFESSEKLMIYFSERDDIPIPILLLQNVAFCMDELDVRKNAIAKFRKLTDCFPGFDAHVITAKSQRVFEKMILEIEGA